MTRTRSSWLWILLGVGADFCTGCTSGHSTAPGFGTHCASDEQCAAVGLVCGADQRCVECLADLDCRSDEQCASGQCRAAKSAGCSTDADCSGGTVCDANSGACVQCLTSSDCGSGEICLDQSCSAATSCATSSDCPSGLVCDAGLGTCVQCVVDRDCAGGDVCLAHECAPDTGTGGAGGTLGTGGTAGQSTGGTGGATGGTGGATGGTGGATGGTGGATGGTGGSTGGTGATGGSGATGGTGGGCNCSGGLECTTEGCSDPNVIDNFSTCDLNVTPVRSRHGQWYAAADTGINQTFAVGVPGSAWSDRSCSAWTTGGPTGTGTTNWAVLGVVIADGSAYDLRAYSGVSVLLESGGRVQVIVKTADGGYFANWAASTSGSQTRNIAFSSMYAMANSSTSVLDLSRVIEFQFSPEFPDTGYGYAVHRLSLY